MNELTTGAIVKVIRPFSKWVRETHDSDVEYELEMGSIGIVTEVCGIDIHVDIDGDEWQITVDDVCILK